jgi:DNA-binding SARP family transcriptional activator
MSGKVPNARRAAAIAGAAALLALLWLAWQIRPPLPALPRALSAPLTHGEISAALSMLAWALFVLLDLLLLVRAVELGARRTPTAAELRLQQALGAGRKQGVVESPDWRRYAAPLAPPVMRLVARKAVAVAVAVGGGSEQPAQEERVAAAPAAAIRGAHQPAVVVDDRPQLRLLGPLELAGGVGEQPRRKATAELIAYLALHPQGATRDELFAALWPDDPLPRSEQRFWRVTTELRRLLPDGLRRDGERYLLDRNKVEIDLDQLEQLSRSAAMESDACRQRALLEEALALFRGEPFAGIGTDWAEAEARRLRAVFVATFERLGRLRLDAGDAVGALAAAERGITLDDLNEPLWRLALEAEAALGLRQAVMERYEMLTSLLAERLGLEPQRETRALGRQLLGQE